MFCSKCGKKIETDEKYCSSCGNLNDFEQIGNTDNRFKKLHRNKLLLITIFLSVVIIVLLIIVMIVLLNNNSNVYFSSEDYTENEKGIVEETEPKKKNKYSTIIINDNVYTGMNISTKEDAYKIISDDSTKQKETCPDDIVEIENRIIEKYGITAVNLCEMDKDFALEVESVIKRIYEDYPKARGYLTNITLVNVSIHENYIAAFLPTFQFASSSAEDTYPWVMKTQILLNTTYFLNIDRMENSIKESSISGHFPPNATKYSSVAHEFGHYLSFICMLNDYQIKSILLMNEENKKNIYSILSNFSNGEFSIKMIEEAYNNYKTKTNTTMSLEEFRGSISQYAIAKDNNGEYIYDETIAEAFHDCYLNDDSAKDASKEILNVLKKYLNE